MGKVTDELTFWKRGGLSGLCLRRRVRDWMLVGPPPRKSTRRKGRTDQAQKTLKNGSKQKRRLWPAVSGITITCCQWQAGPLWLVSPAGSVRLSQGTPRRIALIQTWLIYLQRLKWLIGGIESSPITNQPLVVAIPPLFLVIFLLASGQILPIATTIIFLIVRAIDLD